MPGAVGLDFGTTNTLCAWLDGAEPVLIPNARGERLTPSALAVLDSGELVYGSSARNQALADPESVVLGLKRKLGRADSLSLKGKSHRPEELAAALLSKVRKDAAAYLGFEPRDAVVTVPARFSEPQRRSVRDAAAMAGFKVLRVMNEPTAAALARAWTLPKDSKDRLVLVYDFGGGTFDATVLKSRGPVSRVLASEGDDQLGGMDLDQALYAHVAERFKRDYGIDPDADPYLRRVLLDRCEAAKIELSELHSATVAVPFLRGPEGVTHPAVGIARDVLEDLAAPVVGRTMAITRSVLKAAGVEPGAVDALVLSGGSSRMPLVSRLLGDLCGRAADPRVNPEEIVALGAAIEAARLSGDLALTAPGFEFTDVSSRILGLEIDGGGMLELIHKNQALPAIGQRMFTTVEDYQSSVEIHVLQADDPDQAGAGVGRLSVGRFLLSGIRPAKRGVPRIQIEFELDESDMLTVRARDLDSGADQTVNFLGGRDPELSPVERALALSDRARRLSDGMSLDPAMTAELNELVESARDAAARADTDKAGQCAELLEALCAELDSRALAER